MYCTNLPPLTDVVGSVTIAALLSNVWTSVYELQKKRVGEVNPRGTLSRNGDVFVWLIQSEVLLHALWVWLLRLKPGQVRNDSSRSGHIYHSQDGFERCKSGFCYALRLDHL